MDPRIETVIVFLGWTVLRIGLPVLITAIVVLWLKQLDANWKEEAILEGEADEALPACWELLNCPPGRRAGCPAYQHAEIACWQVFRLEDGGLKPACLDCEVYRRAPVAIRAAHHTAH
jgi:hypothetical protein